MQKEDFETRDSSGILNVLFKKVLITDSINNYLETERKCSIMRQYKIDKKIIKLAKNQELMIKYLNVCFEKIVKPMTEKLKEYMKNFKISTESEIFCNDLSFKILHSDMPKKDYRREMNHYDDDKELSLQTKNSIISLFRSEFDSLVQLFQSDHNAKLNLAVALYFASYYDEFCENKELFDAYENIKDFQKFKTNWSEF